MYLNERIMDVIKSSGQSQPFEEEKLEKVVFWAVGDLKGVRVDYITRIVKESVYDGMHTSEIHNLVTLAAAQLIGAGPGYHPNYSLVAGRLEIFRARKEAYGQPHYPDLGVHAQKLVDAGVYDAELLEPYDADQLEELNDYIKPERDLQFHYAGSMQMTTKYLIKNRVTGRIFDAPQHAAMLIGMAVYPTRYSGEELVEKVKEFYDTVTKFIGSLPTPVWGGVRTPLRQFSSCVVVEAGDSLPEINAASSVATLYGAARAGLGINAGMIRGEGSAVKNGLAYHTGIVPFLKKFEAAVKSCSQGGIRGASATMFYPIWHQEFEDLVVLKNNKGLELNRVRRLDHAFQVNGYLWNRLKTGDNITLFSPHDVPGLYDAFFENTERWIELYEAAELNPNVPQQRMTAADVFTALMTERTETSRVYIMNVDLVNEHSSFVPEVAPIRQSNLCMEVTLPTRPLQTVDDPEGEISLCTLSAVNMGKITTNAQLEKVTRVLVEFLDTLLDYQDYLMPAADNATKRYRPLGIGVTNLANWLAKRDAKYSDGSGNDIFHEFMEAFQYYLIKASVNLAKRFNPAPGFHTTKYSRGQMPIDHHSQGIDDLHKAEYQLDWAALRQSVMRHGMRNCTLSAQMPCESSSQVTNSTNGIEPVRDLVAVKTNADIMISQIVPDYAELKDKYETLWQMPDNRGYLTLCGIQQKFLDQSISTNTNYNPSEFEGGNIPMTVLLADQLFAYNIGIKTMYYQNMADGAGGEEDDVLVDSSADLDSDDCQACKL